MSRTIYCLVIDNEPSAQQVLETYISDTPQLEHAASCVSALEAMDYLEQDRVDLIFLDINMPKLSGIDFLKSFQDAPPVVLSTAYDEYALEGYELDVVDYLLKPYSYERFLKAIQKARKRIGSTENTGGDDTIPIKSDGKMYRIPLDEVLYFESLGDYVKVRLPDDQLIFHDSLKNLQRTLPKESFTRVHKSYIVYIPSVDYLEGNQLKIGTRSIPVGGTYREDVLRYFT